MEYIFAKILSLAVGAIPVLLMVLLFRLVFFKAPKNSRQVWWILAALSLLPIPYPEVIQYIIASIQKTNESQLVIINTISNSEIVIPKLMSVTEEVSSVNIRPSVKTISWPHIISWIWLVGVVVMIVYAICQIIILYRRTDVSIRERNNIVLCDNISAPFVVGIIHPSIYLPSSIDKKGKELVLLHENAHIKRKDTLWKIIGYIFLSVFWFHPLVWICYYLFNRDIEYACDEYVIRTMEKEEKKEYAAALLSLSTSKKQYPHSLVSFSANNVKQRIKEIVRNKKIVRWLSGVVLAIGIICGILFLPSKNEIYDSFLPQVPVAENENDFVVPIDLDKNKPYFVYRNSVFHLVDMGSEVPLDSIHIEEISESVSKEEQKYWKEQIEMFNKEYYLDRNFEARFYKIEGFSTNSYLALVDNKRSVAVLLINDNGYVLHSPYELFEEKAALSNFVSVTILSNETEKRIFLSKGDPEQEDQIAIIIQLLSEISQANFEAPLYSKRLSSAFKYYVSFVDVNGIERTLYISRDREVYLPQFGDTPGVIISQELYDQVVGLFMRGEE